MIVLYYLATEDEVTVMITNLYTAGTESTSTTLLWTIVFMMNHRDIMHKVQVRLSWGWCG